MADLAALGLEIKSDSVKEATANLRALTTTSSAAEKAAQKWGMTVDEAGKSAEAYSRRVRNVISSLEFERQQLTRSAAEQQKYQLLRRAGVTAESQAGQAILASVSALQAQRAALQQNTVATASAATSTNAFAGHLRGLLSVYGAISVGRTVLETAEAYTRFANSLKVAGVEGEAFTGVQERLFQAANRHGVEIGALGQLYGRLTLSGKELGATQGEMLRFVDGVTAALRVQGGSTAQASGALMQLSQALGSGIVRAEEFNSILEGALPIAQAAARGMDGMGGSVAKLRAAVVEGKVTSQDFFAAMLRGFKETEAQADKSARTVDQAMTSLRNSFTLLVGGVDQATGATRVFAELISTLAARLENLGNVAKSAKTDVLALLAIATNPGGYLGAVLGSPTPMQAMDSKIADARKKLSDADARLARDPGRGADVRLRAQYQRELDALERERSVMAVAGKVTSRDPGDPDNIGILVNRPPPPPVATKTTGGGARSAREKAPEIDRAAEAYRRLTQSAREFVAEQQLEQQALFMSTEAAARLRFEHDMLNKAGNDNITLTDQQRQEIAGLSVEMAAAAERTRSLTDVFETGREIFSGFFSDLREGLMNGKSLWESFGNAALNVLNRITEKLLTMAVENLWEKALGPAFRNLLGGIGGAASAGSLVGSGMLSGTGGTYALGAAFLGGNVIPFARGGIVSRPTLFPMARGMGLMGEAGPEAVMPLRRGPGGRLGVEASGKGGNVVVVVNNNADGTRTTARETQTPDGRLVEVLVETVKGSIASDIGLNRGPVPAALNARYGTGAARR